MAATGQEAVALEQLRTWGVAVSGEIDKKVDSPATSGTAGQVLSTNGTTTEWITLPEGTAYTGTAPIQVEGSAISIAAATTSAAGSMSAADKAKLDGVAENANNYTLPAATASAIGGVKPGTGCEVTGDGTLNVTVTGGGDYEGTAPIVVAGNAISITAASTSAAGSMSAADKTKLDGIANGANNYVLPPASDTVLGGVKFASDTDFNAYMGIA